LGLFLYEFLAHAEQAKTQKANNVTNKTVERFTVTSFLYDWFLDYLLLLDGCA